MSVHVLTSTGRIYEKLSKQDKPTPPNISDGGWDREGDAEIEKILLLTRTDMSMAIRDAITQMSKEARYYQTFSDMEKNLIISLQKRFNLSQETLNKIDLKLKDLYAKDKESVIFDIPVKIRDEKGILKPLSYGVKDQATSTYIRNQNDFYFGKFFQGDQKIRQEVLHWMDQYYLDKGNPIGKGQKGIDTFLSLFKDYITDKSEKKARQILDTSLNHIRNAGRIRGMSEAGIELFRIDTQGDRLTCAICRSYDGRVFQVSSAISLLESIEKQGPESIKTLKPFVTRPVNVPSVEISNKYPPFHMHCRCKAVAYWQRITDSKLPHVTTLDVYNNLSSDNQDLIDLTNSLVASSFTRQELQNRIESCMGASWYRKYDSAEISNTDKHFSKHSEALGHPTKEEYLKGAYKVIKNPEKVYIQKSYFIEQDKSRSEKVDYIFETDNKRVIVNEDDLIVKSYHPINISKDKWLKNAIKQSRATIQIKP